MAVFGIRPQLIALLVCVMLLAPPIFVVNYAVGGTMLERARAHIFTFPNGGRRIFPDYRLVALYGTPGTPELGALGEQDADAAIERARALAATYQPLVSEHVLPTLEIITTVASGTPADNGTYSYLIDTGTLAQWIAKARAGGVYVVLDLQPGRNDFLTQAKTLEPLLEWPNVGLALDPEWRLGPTQLPLQQIGSVDIREVNATINWLADLTRQNHLPQKLLLLHEFRSDMLPNRSQLDTARAELAYALQMDGQGSQSAKLGTWQVITADPPANVHFGWKNFYKKDNPTRSPQDTVSLTPEPWYISYQ